MVRLHRIKMSIARFKTQILLNSKKRLLVVLLMMCIGLGKSAQAIDIEEWKTTFYSPDLVEMVSSDLDSLIDLNAHYIAALKGEYAKYEASSKNKAKSPFGLFMNEYEKYVESFNSDFVKKALLLTFLGHYESSRSEIDDQIRAYKATLSDFYFKQINSVKNETTEEEAFKKINSGDKDLITSLKSLCEKLKEHDHFFNELRPYIVQSSFRYDVFCKVFGKHDYFQLYYYDGEEEQKKEAEKNQKKAGAWRPKIIKINEEYHKKFMNLLNSSSLKLFFPIKKP
jgi:hypothetical protein